MTITGPAMRTVGLVGVAFLMVSCGNSSTGGSGYSCGAGTQPVGSQCVAVTNDAGASKDSSVAEGGGGDASNCQTAMLYPDKDGDGFGAALEAAVSQCVGSTGYAGNNLDCADGDARAHPGQVAFFGTQITGAATVAPYDFNCDGKVDLQYPDRQQCSTTTTHPPGWQGVIDPIPQCGESGSLNTSKCEEVTTVQGCH